MLHPVLRTASDVPPHCSDCTDLAVLKLATHFRRPVLVSAETTGSGVLPLPSRRLLEDAGRFLRLDNLFGVERRNLLVAEARLLQDFTRVFPQQRR